MVMQYLFWLVHKCDIFSSLDHCCQIYHFLSGNFAFGQVEKQFIRGYIRAGWSIGHVYSIAQSFSHHVYIFYTNLSGILNTLCNVNLWIYINISCMCMNNTVISVSGIRRIYTEVKASLIIKSSLLWQSMDGLTIYKTIDIGSSSYDGLELW